MHHEVHSPVYSEGEKQKFNSVGKSPAILLAQRDLKWENPPVIWRRKWQPTPVFLPRESSGQRSLVGC